MLLFYVGGSHMLFQVSFVFVQDMHMLSFYQMIRGHKYIYSHNTYNLTYGPNGFHYQMIRVHKYLYAHKSLDLLWHLAHVGFQGFSLWDPQRVCGNLLYWCISSALFCSSVAFWGISASFRNCTISLLYKRYFFSSRVHVVFSCHIVHVYTFFCIL